MKQGTVSVLVGCHSQIHSLCVLFAWRKLYHRWPAPWKICCIALHDIGHWGKQYLDNVEEKHEHWRLGAKVAGRLFGERGYLMVAGHDEYSGLPESALRKPDKLAWLIAPRLWLWMNIWVEPKIRRHGTGRWEHTGVFKEAVRKNVESGRFGSTHDIYLAQNK